jgi:hypothetical protein
MAKKSKYIVAGILELKLHFKIEIGCAVCGEEKYRHTYMESRRVELRSICEHLCTLQHERETEFQSMQSYVNKRKQQTVVINIVKPQEQFKINHCPKKMWAVT